MKLGILLAGRRPDDVVPRLSQARDAGFSLCQLNLMQTGFTRGDLVAIADSMLEFGIRPVALGCYVNPLKPDEGGPIGVTRADLDTVLQSLDLIGARRVVLWSGTHADMLYDEHPDNGSEESAEALRAFLGDVVAGTRARHYYLVLEPWHTHVLSSEERILEFHGSLDPAVADRVRYVVDAPSLITPERYPERDAHACNVCQAVGELAGLVHLKDCIMPPDGEAAMPGPGQGKLDYEAYLKAVVQYTVEDTPAVVRNVPAAEYAAIRDYMLRMGTDLGVPWELA